MRSGNGYMYYSNNASSQSFMYPSASSRYYGAPVLRNSTEQKWSVNVHRFANTMTLTSIAVIDNVELQSDQIEIAAFAGNDCRGSILLQNVESLDRHLGFLMVYGEAGEALTFKVYDHATGTEYAANNVVNFAPDAIHGTPIAPFVISNAPTGLEDITANQITVYPNPVKDLLQINHSLKSIDILQLTDLTGRILIEETNFTENTLNLSSLANGVYLLKLTKDSQNVVIKVTKK
jgi:hypothetical protein